MNNCQGTRSGIQKNLDQLIALERMSKSKLVDAKIKVAPPPAIPGQGNDPKT